MNLREEDAKKRTCPFITYCTNQEEVYSGKQSPMMQHQTCEGAACMGWRWATTEVFAKQLEEVTLPAGEIPPMPDKEDRRWLSRQEKNKDDTMTWGLFMRVGHCGMAGNPLPK